MAWYKIITLLKFGCSNVFTFFFKMYNIVLMLHVNNPLLINIIAKNDINIGVNGE